MERLLQIIARLRAKDGCPWDREQTHQSLRHQLIEECYELIEALDNLEDAHIREELGDVLLLIVLHAQIASERGAFDFHDIAEKLCEKLIRRHPHVFGEKEAQTASAVLKQWEEIKREEKPERTSALDGVPKHLPALLYAQKIQKKAAKVGFDWDDTAPVFEKIREEVGELEEQIQTQENLIEKIEEELGDLFFALTNLSRHLKLDAEQACRLASEKFARRFGWLEQAVRADGLDIQKLSLSELDAYWEKAKKTAFTNDGQTPRTKSRKS